MTMAPPERDTARFVAEKALPSDRNAESAVVASLLVDPDAFDAIAGRVVTADFYHDALRWIFEACGSVHQRGETVNQVTVAHQLASAGTLDKSGGLPYLARLVDELPTPIGVEHYAEIVANASRLRRLVSVGSEIVRLGYDAGTNAVEAAGKAEQLIRAIESPAIGDIFLLRDVLNEFWDRPGVYASEETGMIRTGFLALDGLVGGLRDADLIIVGARPSMGKSALLLNLARNAAVGQRKRVLIASLEMRRSEWGVRALAAESGIDSKRIQLWQTGEDEEQRLMAVSSELGELPIALVDVAHLSVLRLRQAVRTARKALGGVDLVIVDYLQLMRGEDRRGSRLEQVTEISRELKLMAREFDVPVVAASQLSRNPEGRERKTPRPVLSDLRDSGAIEQDADVVVLMWRPEYYTKREDWKPARGAYPEGLAEIIVAKNRNGPTGNKWLRFSRATSLFTDTEPAPEPEPDYPTDARLGI